MKSSGANTTDMLFLLLLPLQVPMDDLIVYKPLEDEFYCSECGLTGKDRASMYHHIKDHAPEKVCYMCGKTYRRNENHMFECPELISTDATRAYVPSQPHAQPHNQSQTQQPAPPMLSASQSLMSLAQRLSQTAHSEPQTAQTEPLIWP